KRDNLVGLKENVILGHLVPTGTGFRDHSRTRVKKNIDFGELGNAGQFDARVGDTDLESLVSGLDPLAMDAGLLMAAGGSVVRGEEEDELAATPALPAAEGEVEEEEKRDPLAESSDSDDEEEDLDADFDAEAEGGEEEF
ncbi:MAG: hypothetical protein ACKO4Q_14015, partial [Planctomycetota bacterium]